MPKMKSGFLHVAAGVMVTSCLVNVATTRAFRATFAVTAVMEGLPDEAIQQILCTLTARDLLHALCKYALAA